MKEKKKKKPELGEIKMIQLNMFFDDEVYKFYRNKNGRICRRRIKVNAS